MKQKEIDLTSYHGRCCCRIAHQVKGYAWERCASARLLRGCFQGSACRSTRFGFDSAHPSGRRRGVRLLTWLWTIRMRSGSVRSDG